MTLRNLNTDYLDGDKTASEWLGGSPNLESLLLHVRDSDFQTTRATVLATLENHHRLHAKGDQAITSSLERLADGAVVVCAGQQPGLLGGPLLSLYKAMTAIRLAEDLTSHGVFAVPLFWNASEDHDFDEANKLCFPPAEGDQEPTFFALPRQEKPKSLSKTQLTSENSQALLDKMKSLEVDESWFLQPEESLGTWMTRLMLQMTRGSGLLVCEPHWFNSELRPLRQQLIIKRSELFSAIAKRSEELSKAGYNNPISLDQETETGLFYEDKGLRLKIKAGGSEIRFGEHRISQDELLERLKESPGSFSSGVMTRPAAQQFLFPVAAQIAGPTETAYLAQVTPLIAALNIQRCIFWPRSRFTLLTEEAELLSLRLKLSDQEILDRRFDENQEASTQTTLDEMDTAFRRILADVDQVKDPELRKELIESRRDILGKWQSLKKDVKRFEKKRRKPKTRLVHALKAQLQPRGIPQERIFGVASLGFNADRQLFDILWPHVDPSSPVEKLVRLKRAGNS